MLLSKRKRDVLRIMPVGDSLTHASSGDYSWRYFLWKHLESNGINATFVGRQKRVYEVGITPIPKGSQGYADDQFPNSHEARAGVTLEMMSMRIDEALEANRADIPLVLLGANDLMETKNWDADNIVRFIASALAP